MRNQETVAGALKAAEDMGEGHGRFWKQWLEEPLASAHLRSESSGLPCRDELRMRRDERSRANGLTPRERVLLSEDFGC